MTPWVRTDISDPYVLKHTSFYKVSLIGKRNFEIACKLGVQCLYFYSITESEQQKYLEHLS